MHLLARPPSAVTPPRRLFPIQSCLLCRPKNGTSCLAPASACAQSACTQQTLARPNSPWLFSCQFQLHQRPSQCSCHFSSFLLQTREAGYLPHARFFSFFLHLPSRQLLPCFLPATHPCKRYSHLIANQPKPSYAYRPRAPHAGELSRLQLLPGWLLTPDQLVFCMALLLFLTFPGAPKHA